VGLGEGISPAAATDVIARSVPLSERSRAVAFTFNGFSIGSVLGLSLAPAIITNFGWRSVFFLFGGVGLGWVAWVGNGVYKRGGASPDADPKTLVGGRAPVKGLLGKRVMLPEKCEVDGSVRFSSDDCDVDVVSASGSGSFDDDGVRVFMMDEEDPEEDFLEEEPEPPVPWGEIFSCVPVRALAYVHFCNNWGFYVLLAWLPSYFTQEIGVNLTNASLFTLLPPLANIVVASFVGPLADAAIERATPVNVVRKTAQSVAFFGPATFMGLACFDYFDNPLVTVGLLTVGLSLSSFSYAGLYCNHQDMSPRYASILLGMTNTVGAFPGVIGVPLTGYLLERTDNWEVSMFAPAVFFYVTGAAVFAKWGSAEKQEWG
jgi:MFS transporter, ACS family, solute carrier family 17 (sodium-dependent inorganic phosphate cotransporter), other